MKIKLLVLLFVVSSCGNKQDCTKLNDYELIELVGRNDQKLHTPQKGEWLYTHKEGQTFEQYKLTKPIRPDKNIHTIYLQPIGSFSSQQKEIIRYTADYLKIFFGLKTIVLNYISDSVIPKHARRVKYNGSEQLLASYILDSMLLRIKPTDAIAYMAITEKDLYPQDSWNFVFGLASYQQKIGVSSLFRYSKKIEDSLSARLCLERLIQTSSHEIGHMFSFYHCTHALCVMNGSNSLTESDTQPNRLCSECLSKLHWNFNMDIRKRLYELKNYFQILKLQKSYSIIEKDIALLQE